jgi:hypothetical protein
MTRSLRHVAVHWHIASLGCAAEFGRDRGSADIDEPLLINLIDEYTA